MDSNVAFGVFVQMLLSTNTIEIFAACYHPSASHYYPLYVFKIEISCFNGLYNGRKLTKCVCVYVFACK